MTVKKKKIYGFHVENGKLWDLVSHTLLHVSYQVFCLVTCTNCVSKSK